MSQFVIIYREAGAIQIDRRVIGPFEAWGDAYEALCEMPAPGYGGEKYIAPLEAPSAVILSGIGTQPDPRAAAMVSEAAELLEQYGDQALGDL